MTLITFERLPGNNHGCPFVATANSVGMDLPICLRRPFYTIKNLSKFDPISGNKPENIKIKTPMLAAERTNMGYNMTRELSDSVANTADTVDLYKEFGYTEDPVIKMDPNTTMMFGTGFKCEFNTGYMLNIFARSSTGHTPLMLANNVAVIDPDYRGELFIVFWNRGDCPFFVFDGQKLAQCILTKVAHPDPNEGVVDTNTTRGQGGFGSTLV